MVFSHTAAVHADVLSVLQCSRPGASFTNIDFDYALHVTQSDFRQMPKFILTAQHSLDVVFSGSMHFQLNDKKIVWHPIPLQKLLVSDARNASSI